MMDFLHTRNIVLIKYYLGLVFLIALNSSVFSQQKGDLLISSYTSEDYNAHIQNWAAIQDANGIMYFGNLDSSLISSFFSASLTDSFTSD